MRSGRKKAYLRVLIVKIREKWEFRRNVWENGKREEICGTSAKIHQEMKEIWMKSSELFQKIEISVRH